MNTANCYKMIVYLISDVAISLIRKVRRKKSYICKFAFNSLHMTPEGYSCCCESPVFGTHNDFNTAQDFLDSKMMSEFRRRILKGDYGQCPESCHTRLYAENGPVHNYDVLKSWGRIVVGNGRVFGEFRKWRNSLLNSEIIDTFHMTTDDRCNLNCIMCRNENKKTNFSEKIDDQSWGELHCRLKSAKVICIGGTGEPLIQKRSLQFLTDITEEHAPELEQVVLITNGGALTEQLFSQFSPFVIGRLHLRVSIDAATSETYQHIRKGGDFDQLCNNLNHLSQQQLPSFTLSMCVQELNLSEMVDFVYFARQFNAISSFGQINGFPEKACHLTSHPRHHEFLEIIRNEIFDAPDVLGNFISRFRIQA